MAVAGDRGEMVALLERLFDTTGVVVPLYVMSFAFTLGVLFNLGPRIGKYTKAGLARQIDGEFEESQRRLRLASPAASARDLISMRQPVSFAAKRAFCPSRPMARLS